ncbi:hypothetical protein GXP67_22835 [Rhodocytophaga rosea]|uniref:Uncharacterized protein n=1 Tax=Rhodocytophaga rosea TaxID=2704465 RepID=A0A6C0GMK5_9BACT|nr:hypothetical protein [Rhodocytophaga rosea]QHT69268.1 hypothetical protein GXP67_22835 [Rhodocytophaga rosea]
MVTFDADLSFLYLASGVSLLVLLLLAWLAWRRVNKKRLAWRMAASSVGMISLMMLALKPQFRQTVLPQEAILLTEGTNQDSLQSLLQTFTGDVPAIFTTDSSSSQSFAKQEVKWTPDIAYLRRNHPQVNRLHILGYGLSHVELDALDSLQAIPHLSLLEGGFHAVHWPQLTQAGEALHLQGIYENKAAQPVKLVLEGFGLRLDSLEIPASQTKEFDLQTLVKESGSFVYSLNVFINNRLIAAEKIPILVEPPSLIRFIILESFPGFEVKFLKTWLSERQYTGIVRTTISRDKYRTEYINQEKVNANTLNATLLETIDLVIADEQSVSGLSSREQAALQQAMEEKGVGLLILWKEPQNRKGNLFTNSFKINTPPRLEEQPTRVTWPDMSSGAVSISATGARIEYSPGTRPMVQDEKGGILVSTQVWGRGKMMASLLNSSYMWVLDGKQTLYSSYWSALLSSLVAGKEPEQTWQIASKIPLVHHPLTYTLTTYASQTPVGLSGNVSFYLAQDALNPQRWKGTFWPDSTGWRVVQTEGGNPYWHYIYSSSNWKDLQWKERREATLQWANRQHMKLTASSTSVSQFVTKPVSSLWFFLLFLGSMAYLWIERKL